MRNAPLSRPIVWIALATAGLAVAAGCTEQVVVEEPSGNEGVLARPTAVPPPPLPTSSLGDGAVTNVPDAGAPRDAAQPPRDSAVADASVPDTALPVDATPADSATGATLPVLDEVVISEVMYDPSTAEPSTEWLELTNTTAAPKLLSGLTLTTPGGGSFTFPASPELTIAPGAYVVIAQNRVAAVAALVPAASIVAEYGAALGSLSNGNTGGVSLSNGATVIARANYAGFFASPQGASIQLKTLTFAAAATAANWCVSPTAFAVTADKGTPGAPSNCP